MISFNKALELFSGRAVFTAFDIESTGLNPQSDKIVEIGAVKFDIRGIIARFSALVNPGIPMPAEAEKIHKISDEMLKNEPSMDAVLPDFLSMIKGTVLIAHNAQFDCSFINEELKNRCDTGSDALPLLKKTSFPSSLQNPIADTLAFSREAFPGRRSHSLQNLAADFGIPAHSAHRAEDDARLCMEIFIKCIKSRTGE